MEVESKMTQMLELAGKICKVAVVTMLGDVKEHLFMINEKIINLSQK